MLGRKQNRKGDLGGFAGLSHVEDDAHMDIYGSPRLWPGETRILVRSILFGEEIFDKPEARSARLPIGVVDSIDLWRLLLAIGPENRKHHSKKF